MGLTYISVEEARHLEGLRLVLSRGVPGPWGEAAKAIFKVKGLDFVAVAQEPGGENAALKDWTGQTSAPVAVYENERPRTGWFEILLLAERLAPDPPLVPRDEATRADMFGLAFEICGEGGFGWNRRWLLLDRRMELARATGVTSDVLQRLYGKFVDDGQRPAVIARVVAILDYLSGRLRTQASKGSRYLVGDALTAADLYWATLSNLVAPLPAALCPMPESTRESYSAEIPEITAALHPRLLEHRDRILEDHVGLPMVF